MTMLQIEAAPESPDHELTSRLYEMYQQARRAKMQKHETWRRNYLLAMNRWGRSPDDPRDSEIYPILRARVAWMTDQEMNFGIDPASEPFSTFHDFEVNLAEQLECLLRTNFKVYHWLSEVAKVLWDAPMYGAGIFKVGWDSGLDDGLGNVCMHRVDPWAFYPDPNATSFKDAQFLFEVHRWSLDEIERRFPNVDRRRIEEAVMAGDRTQLDQSPQKQDFPRYSRDGIPLNLGQGPVSVGLPGQGTSVKGVMSSGINVYECWLHENVVTEREPSDPKGPTPEPVVTDRWRVIVFTGECILLDETAEDLWDLDRHPYERYVDDEVGEFWGPALVSHLAPLQLFINQLLSAGASNVLLTSNPIFVDYENSGLARTAIINRPGQRLTLKKDLSQQGLKPDWLAPPAMTTDIPNLIEFSIGRMENIAGLSGVSKGQQPSGRQAQQTTQAVQESGFVSIRSSLRNMEQSLSRVGELLCHLIIINYDVPRVTAIVGGEGEETALRLASYHFYTPTEEGKEPLKFVLNVNAGASSPTSRQARIAELDALAAMGMVDQTAVLQAHRLPHWQQIVARMQAAQQAERQFELQHPELSRGGKGQPRGPGTGHAH
jgi:hypothetical protein